ncbi:dihydrolipoyl dehydrogenase family protein [Aestuariibius sp. 2305UL40-4]|uniref:dihydrolipoyl dehydrogenase family protein n=1 Tax=Aestuariibius violaceus TaxID=3234132 RepID=UPI00345EF8E1
MANHTFDLIVIGGGSAGLACAKRAAGHGARVALIERDHLGGTCVNRGCVPKKLMWEASEVFARARSMADLGLSGPPGTLDLAALKARIDSQISDIRGNFEDDLADKGVTLIRATATLDTPGEVRAGGRTLTAPHIVLATGGAPQTLPIDGAELFDTSDDVFGWTTIPERLVVIGGGYIGCEFASIFRAFGAQVRIVNEDDRLLTDFDADAVAHAAQTFENRGIAISNGLTIDSARRNGTRITLTLSDGTTDMADRVLCATGRSPNIDGLGKLPKTLEKADTGALAIDARFETSQPGVYAIGDVADRLPLTPVATRDGEALADILFGQGAPPIDLDLVATATFLHPPMGQVGQPDTGDLLQGDTTPLPEGTVWQTGAVAYGKVARDPDTQKVIGAVLIGESAADEIAWAAAAIAGELDDADLLSATAVHPTLAEEIIGRR